jgi:GNAT superfamily N-acetyltransferase
MSRLTLAPMEAWDTVHVFPMLEQMAADEQRPYPRQTPEDRKRAQSWLLDRIGASDFGAFVVRDGQKAKGVCWGVIEPRHFMQPARVLDAKLIYVAPSHRTRGIGHRLLTALLDWGRERLGDDAVMEGVALVDGPALPMWIAAGWRPVATRIAWVDADGQPRAEAPLAPSGPDTARSRRRESRDGTHLSPSAVDGS